MKAWSGFAATLAAMMIIPAAYLHAWDATRTETPENLVQGAGDADYVFIGHSLTGSRIDVGILDSLLEGGQSSALVWGVSAGPDIWYLMLKNEVIGKGMKPKLAFSFFTGNNLFQNPKPPTNRRQQANLLRFRSHVEPEYDAVLRNVTLRYKMASYGQAVYPTRAEPGKATDELAKAAGYAFHDPLAAMAALNPAPILKSVVGGKPPFRDFAARDEWKDYRQFQKDMNDSLTSLALRAGPAGQVGAERDDDELDLRGTGSRFLELMLDLSAEHDVDWVFVRIRPRPDGDGSHADTTTEEQREHLEQWLNERGAQYIDLTDEDEIRADWYSDQVHMFGHEPEYTEWFHQRFKEYFQQ